MNENQEKPLMECLGQYLVKSEDGSISESGEAQIRLFESHFSIRPRFGPGRDFPIREIQEILNSNYRIILNMLSKEQILLFGIGYQYEDFWRILNKLRHQVLLNEMLMDETIIKSGIAAEMGHYRETGEEISRGKCEPRLYETALIIIPDGGIPLRIPYCEMSQIKSEDCSLVLILENGDQLVFSKMGRSFDSFSSGISDRINQLQIKTQNLLHELLPEADSLLISRAARFMKEGKAAQRKDLESISPILWIELEKKLGLMGIQAEYDFLKSLAQKEKMSIGIKRGLLGDLTGEYLWFLVPIYSVDPKKPGNAVAMEAASPEGGGKATYFFRITDRGDYRQRKSWEDWDRMIDSFLKKMNRAMLAINFRREPIFLSEEKLAEPQYQQYRIAISKIPELRTLRKLFIGRIIHSSPEQWRWDVMDLLQFNVSTTDDDCRWRKKETHDN